MHQRFKHKTWYYKTPTRKHREESLQHPSWQWFFGHDSEHKQHKQNLTNGTISNSMGSAPQKKQLTKWKDNPKMGDNFCKPYTRQGVSIQKRGGGPCLYLYPLSLAFKADVQYNGWCPKQGALLTPGKKNLAWATFSRNLQHCFRDRSDSEQQRRKKESAYNYHSINQETTQKNR